MNTQRQHIIISTYDSIKNPYYQGGGALAIHATASHLREQFQVTVLTGNYPGAKDEVIDGVAYRHVGPSWAGPKLGQLLFQVSLIRSAKSRRFDLWIENFTPPFSTAMLQLFTDKPVIGLVHMMCGEDMERKYHLPFSVIEKLGLTTYRNFIATTEEIQHKIQHTNSTANIQVISNGIRLPTKIVTAKQPYILFLGRLEMDQKGIDLLLKAYATAAPKLELRVAGTGSTQQQAQCRELISSLGLEKKVKMIGWLKGADKEMAVSKATAIVVPSRFETFSITALEALAHGTPLLTFDIAGLRWIPADASTKLPAFSIPALSEAMIALEKQPQDFEKKAQRGIAFSKQFDEHSTFKKYDREIARVLHVPSDMKKQLDDMIAEKTQFVFVSPHLDDAVFSAGAVIKYLGGKAPVKVINVFSRGDVAPYTASARAYLRQCGYADIADLYKDRIAEDSAVFSKLELKPTYLGFMDGLWRKRTTGLIRLLQPILPEFGHVYPTYRFHAGRGKVSSADAPLIDAIAKKLREIIGAKTHVVVFCPMGIGGHVDHVAVKQACMKLGIKLYFWSDFPYNLESDLSSVSTTRFEQEYTFENEALLRSKVAFAKQYKTQFLPTFPSGEIPLKPERFFQ